MLQNQTKVKNKVLSLLNCLNGKLKGQFLTTLGLGKSLNFSHDYFLYKQKSKVGNYDLIKGN